MKIVYLLFLTFTLGSSLTGTRNLVLYDGVCRFCNTWVGIVLNLDTQGKFKFAALQSESGKRALSLCGRRSSDISSIVYIPSIDGEAAPSPPKYYIKSEAVVQIGKELGIPTQIIGSILPLALKDDMYDAVASNRYNFLGKYDECRLYHMEYEDRFLP